MAGAAVAESWEAVLQSERQNLLRFCAHLTGDAQAAEDLVQETLYEAWRLRGRLRVGAPPVPWLSAIARHICLRWRRARGREMRHRGDGAAGWDASEPAAAFDIEAELDRGELVELLDRVMAELPESTRRILVQRFVREASHAEIAERMGLSEGAVTMRVQRGKLRLRQILTTRYADEAAAFGLAGSEAHRWEQTRIWCPECGARRLWAQWASGRRLTLECWGCRGRERMILVHSWSGELYWGRTSAEILAGVSGFKPSVSRLLATNHAVYRNGTQGLTARCSWCGRRGPVYVSAFGDVRTHCRHCGVDNGFSTTGGVAFSHPAMQAFWRRHGRIRSLPDRFVESDGVRAVICRTESVVDGSTLQVVLARDTLVTLGVHGMPPE